MTWRERRAWRRGVHLCCKPSRLTVAGFVAMLDIAESDIATIGQRYAQDRWEVALYNGRRLTVDGVQIVRWQQTGRTR